MVSPYLDPKFRSLEKEYDDAVRCNRCGFCETVCPTYMVSGKETLSPRGRNQAFRQILEGKIKNPEEASEIFTTCLTCHACTNVCFSEVPVAKLMAHARDIASQSQTLNRWLGRIVFRIFLSHRKLFSIIIWCGFLLKRLGISKLLRKAGILKKISPALDAADELVEGSPLRFGGNPKNSLLSAFNKGPRSTSAYFSGCGIHYVYPAVSQAFVQVLAEAAPQIQCPSHACCGLTAQSAGDTQSAKKLAAKVIRQFSSLDADSIVVDDDSCCGFMKNYGELLSGDLEAVRFAGKVKNLSEFILDHPSAKTHFQKRGLQPMIVTYHDPCQMGNAHHQVQAPRDILQSIPGIRFVEMEEANWCCGGAGTYCLKHPALAEDILERKLFNIRHSGAQVIVTQASSCLMHIQYGIRKKGWQNKIKVLHLAEFLRID
jgi:glycolate oxidase iron-sulfur subunit